MCDPLTLSLASTAIGAVGTIGAGRAQAQAQQKQADNVRRWQQEQKRFRNQERQRQDEYRTQADAAREEGVEAISADEQKRRQSEEEARLSSYLTGQDQSAVQESGAAPVSVADKTLTRPGTGEDTFQNDIAKKINEATVGARQRMQALARVQSFGNSWGGLGTENPLLQQKAGSGIDKFNEFRRGSMGAFGAEQAIDPVQVTYQPSPLAGLFSTALSFGTQGLGKAFAGGGAAGGLGAGAAAQTVGDPWAGIRFPTTMKAPSFRPGSLF
jgi:hypothetical protein